MADESKVFGRGIRTLLGTELRVSPSRGGGTLPLSLMQPGAFQPRREIHQEPLEELAASIKANGVIQPIVLRRLPAGSVGPAQYEIIAGERRWQAAKMAGLSDIPAIVRELSDRQALAVALIENIQREDLTPAEEARTLKRLIDEFQLTHEAVGKAVGRSRAAVSNLMRLLELPGEVLALIDAKRLSMGHARALLGLEGEAEQTRFGGLVAERGLSVRETENLVRKALKGGRSAAAARRPGLATVTEVLRTANVRVEVQQSSSGAGKLIVEFTDPKTKDMVVEAIMRAIERE